MRWVLLFLTLYAQLPPSGALAQTPAVSVSDFEDLDKTMAVFESAFKNDNEEMLRAVSTRAFQRSAYYQKFRQSLGSLQVNSGMSSQFAEQTFTATPGLGEIAITFRLLDNRWLLKEVKAPRSRPEGIEGLPLLAREYYFSDFRRWIESGNLLKLAGSDGLGQLSSLARAAKTVSPRNETVVTITNLVLHDGKRAQELFFVVARKAERIEGSSRGWLIDNAGSMLEYEEAHGGNRLLLEFLSGKSDMMDFSQPSAFEFHNLEANARPSLPVMHVDYRVIKVTASSFKWIDGKVSFVLGIECTGASWEPRLRVSIRDNRLVLDTQSDTGFAGEPPQHRYLAAATDDGRLMLSVREDVLARPIASFADAIVRRQSVRQMDHGIRIAIEVEGRPMTHAE